MSFILDALKKSELERQRQSVPGLMDASLAPKSKALPIWAIGLGTLFGINLLVLTLVLTRKSVPTAHVSRTADSPAADSSLAANSTLAADAAARAVGTTAPSTQHFSPLDAAPVYAPEIPVAGADAIAQPAPPTARAAASGVVGGGGPAHAAHHADPLLTDADDKAQQEILPTLSEMSLSGAQALPELHLDVHVYATSPAERFVYINMRKYHEGAALAEGPTVERIRRDGVVLNYQGLRFILPRQP